MDQNVLMTASGRTSGHNKYSRSACMKLQHSLTSCHRFKFQRSMYT